MSQRHRASLARHVFQGSLYSLIPRTQARTPPLLGFSLHSMSPFADTNPMDLALPHSHPPPPSYQLSQDEFDQKTSHAIGLSSSIYHPIIDEDGWPSYDAAAFEAVAKSYQQGSSSAVPGADVSRHQRQSSGASASLSPATDSMKVRSSHLPFVSNLPELHSLL